MVAQTKCIELLETERGACYPLRRCPVVSDCYHRDDNSTDEPILYRTQNEVFLFFINDLPEVVTSRVAVFADDTNVFGAIQSDEDRQKLQQDIDELVIMVKEGAAPIQQEKMQG